MMKNNVHHVNNNYCVCITVYITSYLLHHIYLRPAHNLLCGCVNNYYSGYTDTTHFQLVHSRNSLHIQCLYKQHQSVNKCVQVVYWIRQWFMSSFQRLCRQLDRQRRRDGKIQRRYREKREPRSRWKYRDGKERRNNYRKHRQYLDTYHAHF